MRQRDGGAMFGLHSPNLAVGPPGLSTSPAISGPWYTIWRWAASRAPNDELGGGRDDTSLSRGTLAHAEGAIVAGGHGPLAATWAGQPQAQRLGEHAG